MNRLIACALVTAGLLGTPAEGRSEEAYFTTIYSAQRPILNQGRYTHTWVTFVRLTRCKPTDPYAVETFTISWLPTDLTVNPLKLRPEVGVNLPPKETIAWCEANRMEIRQFGPFRVDRELWEIEYERWGVFERGERMYRASDVINAPSDERSTNCCYAVVGPLVRVQRVRPATISFGYLAGAYVMRKFSPYIPDDTKTEPWVSDLIGVPNFRQMRQGLLRGPAE